MIKMVVISVLLGLILCCFIVAGIVAYRIWRGLRAFVLPPGEGQVSPLGQFIQNVAVVVSSQLTMQIKTSLMGKASAASKAVDGIEQDIAGDVLASKSPLVAGVLDMFPSLRKRVLRSPIAAMALQSLNLGSLVGGKNNGSQTETTASNNGFQSKF